MTAAAVLAAAEAPTPAGRAVAPTTPRPRPHSRADTGLTPGESNVPGRPAESITRSADGVMLPTSQAIVAENAKPGHLWWVTTPQGPGDIEGYASQVSAVAGETVTLFVSTRAASFHVEAYRMGYYGGVGGRLVWQSDELAGVRQPPPEPRRLHQHHRMPVGALPDGVHRRHLAPRHLPAEVGGNHRRAAVHPPVRAGRRVPRRLRDPAERDHLAGLQPLGWVQPLLRQPGPGSLLHPQSLGGHLCRPGPYRLLRPPLRPRLGQWSRGFHRQRIPGGVPSRAVGPRRHLLDRRRPARPAPAPRLPPRPDQSGPRRVLVGPDARRGGRLTGCRREPGLPRGQRLLPPGAIRALAPR